MGRNLRLALPAVYAIAIVIAFLSASTTVVIVVVIVGAMLLGLAYAMRAGTHWDMSTPQVRRCTLCWAAWASGFTTSRSMSTCGGRVTHQTTQSAMSSAVSGASTPA